MTESFDGKRIPIDSGLRVSGEYPYYGATGIIDYVDDYIFDGEYVLLAEDGANIIMRNYPVAYLTQGKFWLNNHAHIMRMKDGSNYFLVQMLEKIDYMKYNTGTAQPKLNSKIVKNIEFKLPHIEEQQKIGTFFKQLDDTIALHQRKLDLLKQLKQGYLQKMFPATGESIPEVRFADFDDDWEQCKLGEDVSLENGYAYKSEYFQDEQSKYILLTPANVLEGGGFREGKGRNYSSKGPMPEKFVFKPNDIFVTMTDLTPTAQTLGYAAIIPDDGNVYLHNQRLGKLKSDTLNFNFLITILATDDYHREIVSGASGTTVKHTSPSKIIDYKYMKPSYEEQMQIGKFFDNIDNLITLHQDKLEKLKYLKRAFLNKMFI